MSEKGECNKINNKSDPVFKRMDINENIKINPSMSQQYEVTETVHTRIPVVMIPVEEYNELKNGITEKNAIIRDLNHNADMLRLEMQKNYEEIKELENANKEYKTKINELTEKNDNLKKHIEELEGEIKRLETELNGQKNDNLELLKKIQQLEKINEERENRKKCKKLCIAMQDCNSRYEIEKNINDSEARNSMIELRMDRNNNCHYCDKLLSNEEASGMFYVMGEKINGATPEMVEWFESNYPRLLDGMKDYMIQHKFSKPSENMLKYANRRWDKM